MPPTPRAPAPPTGHEPARGFPNPKATIVPASLATHRINPNGGTICNVKPIPMSAAAYNNENPTCPACADWLSKVRAHTYSIYGQPKEHGSSALEAPETEPPPAPRRGAMLRDEPPPPARGAMLRDDEDETP